MTVQLSDTVRDAKLDAVETAIGASPTLEIWSGTKPANAAAADAGDGAVLATIALPADYMANASGGSKVKSGTWEDNSADATGTATHFRIKQGATVHMQGDVATSASDLVVDSVSFTAGQQFTINTFTWNEGNA